MTTSDVVIVGAGVVGASIAWELGQAGCRVVVVDAGTEPAGGCSHASAGLLVPSHANPLTGAANVRTGLRQLVRRRGSVRIAPTAFATPWMSRFLLACRPDRVQAATAHLRLLGLHSLKSFEAHARTLPGSSIMRGGMVDVFQDESALDRAYAGARAGGLGMRVERITGPEVGSHAPGLGEVAGGLRFPEEAHCDGATYTRTVLAAAERSGATVRWGTRVERLTIRDGRVVGVDTDRGVLEAGAVVLAAGGAARGLSSGAGGPRLLTMAAKGYVVDLPRNPLDPNLPIGLTQDHLVVTPFEDRTRIAGILELGSRDAAVDQGRLRELVDVARRRMPGLSDRPPLLTWAGQRPCSADGLPYLGASTVLEGLHLAAGHGQQGVLLAPVTARLVADGVLGRPAWLPEHVRAAVSPDRHHRPGARARARRHRTA